MLYTLTVSFSVIVLAGHVDVEFIVLDGKPVPDEGVYVHDDVVVPFGAMVEVKLPEVVV